MDDLPKPLLEIMQAARDVSPRLRYPVRNQAEGARALGGEDAEVQYLSRSLKVRQIRKLIPERYFPTESQEDLNMKSAYSEMHHPSVDSRTVV
jgi:hypothetical protein